MKLIQPNCRVQFEASDIEFILSVLRTKIGTADCLIKLLGDEDTRDLILDDESLRKALLEQGGCVRVSTRLYFYVLVRHALRHTGIQGREVADYVAEVLTEFARAEQTRCLVPGQANAVEYLFELLAALQNADERNRFLLRAHIGNYSLFLAGVFPDRIRFRAEQRGFPDLKYYEGLGRSQYRAAGDHRLAQRYDLAGIFHELSDRFESTRVALNDISERLFSLGDPSASIETLLNQNRN